MSFEISYKDLKKEMLSPKALELLSEFVSAWFTKTGELIDVDSDDVVIQVLQKGKHCEDRRLRAIYLHIRVESTNMIENSTRACDAILAHQLMSLIAKGQTCRLPGTRIGA